MPFKIQASVDYPEQVNVLTPESKRTHIVELLKWIGTLLQHESEGTQYVITIKRVSE